MSDDRFQLLVSIAHELDFVGFLILGDQVEDSVVVSIMCHALNVAALESNGLLNGLLFHFFLFKLAICFGDLDVSELTIRQKNVDLMEVFRVLLAVEKSSGL